MKDKMLTTTEVAKFLDMSAWKVRDYIKTKVLKAHKIGNGAGRKGSPKEWRIYEKDLIDFVNKGSNMGDIDNG